MESAVSTAEEKQQEEAWRQVQVRLPCETVSEGLAEKNKNKQGLRGSCL